MNNNDNIIELKSPEESAPDLLTELLRKGAKELIRQAVNAELEELLGEYSEQKVYSTPKSQDRYFHQSYS